MANYWKWSPVTNQMLYYKIYGFTVASELPLDLPTILSSTPDITLKLMAPLNQNGDPDEGVEVDMQKDHTTVKIFGVAEYRITPNFNIEISPEIENYKNSELSLYALGTVFSIVFCMKDMIALHGCCVNVNGQSVVIMGDSGAGKSSIARGFINEGFKLLSDDVSLISFDEEIKIIPSYPSQKLWTDTTDSFQIITHEFERISNRYDKFSAPILDAFEENNLPIGAIILLEAAEVSEVQISELTKKRALEAVFDNTYREEYIHYMNKSMLQLKILSNLVAQVPVYHMVRPANSFTVKRQVNKILEIINSNPIANTI